MLNFERLTRGDIWLPGYTDLDAGSLGVVFWWELMRRELPLVYLIGLLFGRYSLLFFVVIAIHYMRHSRVLGCKLLRFSTVSDSLLGTGKLFSRVRRPRFSPNSKSEDGVLFLQVLIKNNNVSAYDRVL